MVLICNLSFLLETEPCRHNKVVQKFFDMDEQKATQIMLHVHTRGQGLCGIYTHEVAETKTALVNEYAREHEHPLLCVAEVV